MIFKNQSTFLGGKSLLCMVISCTSFGPRHYYYLLCLSIKASNIAGVVTILTFLFMTRRWAETQTHYLPTISGWPIYKPIYKYEVIVILGNYRSQFNLSLTSSFVLTYYIVKLAAPSEKTFYIIQYCSVKVVNKSSIINTLRSNSM